MELFRQILNWDTELFLYLNNFYSDYWDTLMLLITRKETWIPFFLAILFAFVKNYRNKSFLIIFFVALTILASDQISVLLKETIQRLRPVHEPSIQHLVHNVLRKGGLYGFVSSHAANAFAILIFTGKIFRNKGYWMLFLFWALIFSYSRIYSGVHYPLDIIGGALLGCLIGWAFYKLLMFVENHFFLARLPRIADTNLSSAQSGFIFLIFAVLAISALIIVSLLHRYNYL